MPQRSKPDSMKLVNGKPPMPSALQLMKDRGISKPSGHDRELDETIGRRKQSIPRAPRHFSDDERRAWRDVCRPICDRRLWTDHLKLWAEGFAVLLAVSRNRDTDKFNRSILRLYARDQQSIIDLAPPRPKRYRSFADV